MGIQKLFKPYFVKRNHGQCQILIPLIELDKLCEKIEAYYLKTECVCYCGEGGYHHGKCPVVLRNPDKYE